MKIGVDIGASSIKVMAVEKKGKGYAVTAAARRGIGHLSEEERQQVLPRMVWECVGSLSADKKVVLGLTGKDVNLQVVPLPPVKAFMLNTMMKYELDQKTGGAPDLYADYGLMHHPDAASRQFIALMGMARDEFVQERLHLARQAHLDVQDISANAYALFVAYRASTPNETGVTMLLDLGHSNLELVLFEDGLPIFVRNIHTGTSGFIETFAQSCRMPFERAEAMLMSGNLSAPASEDTEGGVNAAMAFRSAAGQFASVLQSSITFAKGHLQRPQLRADRLLLSGGGAAIQGLNTYLGPSLGIGQVDYFNPFARMDLRPLGVHAAAELSKLPTDMAVAAGLAILASTRDFPRPLSFLPPADKKKKEFYRTKFFLYVAAIVFVATLGVLTALAVMRRSDLKQQKAEFEKRTATALERTAELDKLAEEQKELHKRIGMLGQKTLAGRGILDSLLRLSRLLPKRAWIKEIVLETRGEGDKSIRITGLVDEQSEADLQGMLKSVEKGLADPTRGVAAKWTTLTKPPDNPGWLEFTFIISRKVE